MTPWLLTANFTARSASRLRTSHAILVWSFIYEDRSSVNWYIVPRKNRMEGFRGFDRVAAKTGVLGFDSFGRCHLFSRFAGREL